MKHLLLLALTLLAAAPAAAQKAPILVPDVSQHRIDLQSGFTGAELLLFGAIAYPGGRIPEGKIDIAVVIEGPRTPITVREKAKLGGLIWVNAESNSYRTAPSFYAVASSRPIGDIMDDREAYVYEIPCIHKHIGVIIGKGGKNIQDLVKKIYDDTWETNLPEVDITPFGIDMARVTVTLDSQCLWNDDHVENFVSRLHA